ncbi:hypothetical protein BM972_14720, partial [Listeria monocytogenes]|nr:hypothetical protein [Listeria monocytogenes]EAG8253207.1 hypothetical protein [Listeria monocytogenes]EEP6739097.1 ATP-binding protein [Listeria monocytogenes]EJB4735382.1 AAA family ATPase [Listeria monocytogenes]
FHKYFSTLKKNNSNCKPSFIMFIGVPGVGKTTISKIFETNYSFKSIATDEIKYNLQQMGIEYTIEDLFDIQKLMFMKLAEYRVNIISDSNSAKNWQREILINFCKRYRYIFKIVYLTCEREILNKRLFIRKINYLPKRNYVSSDKLNYYINEIEIPNSCSLTIDTGKTSLKQIRDIVDKFIDREGITYEQKTNGSSK